MNGGKWILERVGGADRSGMTSITVDGARNSTDPTDVIPANAGIHFDVGLVR